MAMLNTSYMGLQLKNPIIAGASDLTATVDSAKRLEDAGAAAIATKSLFEEQIQLEQFLFDEDEEKYNYRHPDMITVFPDLGQASPVEHLARVQKIKETVGIPVIASLNAVNPGTWLDYARQLEQTGVDALECNLFASPKHPEESGESVETAQVALVRELKQAVSIPVSLKLSFFYTNPLHTIRLMAEAGADAFVLFNRLFEPDLDIIQEASTFPFNLSHANDYRLPLRYAGLLEGAVRADVCCSTGIFSGETIVKMLLAGAAAVQTVSAVYRHGADRIAEMLRDVEAWMDDKNYGSVADFRGKLSKRHSSDPWAYTRAQYARLLMNPDEIVNNFPTI